MRALLSLLAVILVALLALALWGERGPGARAAAPAARAPSEVDPGVDLALPAEEALARHAAPPPAAVPEPPAAAPAREPRGLEDGQRPPPLAGPAAPPGSGETGAP